MKTSTEEHASIPAPARPMQRYHMVVGEQRECGTLEFSAPDVRQALAAAYHLAGGFTFELWQARRKVCTIHSTSRCASIG
jgi:hypothetical protein